MHYDQKIEAVVEKIICHCGPTLEGVKISSLVNFKTYHEAWQACKSQVKSFLKVDFLELKICKDHTLVLFYNARLLQDTLLKPQHQEFLGKFGYTHFDLNNALAFLQGRFEVFCPHEMGIFLGYPLEDVACFATCGDRPCLAIGYWKVYSDLDGACKTFDLYDEIKAKFSRKLREGHLPTTILTTKKLWRRQHENRRFIR